jgi:hypothetical protein
MSLDSSISFGTLLKFAVKAGDFTDALKFGWDFHTFGNRIDTFLARTTTLYLS